MTTDHLKTLLIAAPWPKTVGVLTQVLGLEDINVIGTVDAAQAIEWLDSTGPDVMIVDPEIRGGMGLLEKARGRAGLATIVVTGNDETAKSVRQHGFENVVIKDNHFIGNVLDAFRKICGAEEPAAEGPNIRILIVDDDPDTLELYSAYLSRRGCEIVPAANAGEALRLLDGSISIDVIVLDVVLPGIGGLDLLAAAMRTSARPGALVVSALSDSEVAKQAYALGAFDYLVKPVDLPQLEASIVACAAHAEYEPLL